MDGAYSTVTDAEGINYLTVSGTMTGIEDFALTDNHFAIWVVGSETE